MQFTTLAFGLAALVSVPIANAAISCPSDTYSFHKTTYDAECGLAVTSFGNVVGSMQATNFVHCMQQCTASSKHGTCCGGAQFELLTKMCTLYDTITGTAPAEKTKTGTVTVAYPGC